MCLGSWKSTPLLRKCLFQKFKVSSVSLEALKEEKKERAAAGVCFIFVCSLVEFAFQKLCSGQEEDASTAIASKLSVIKEGGRAVLQPAV